MYLLYTHIHLYTSIYIIQTYTFIYKYHWIRVSENPWLVLLHISRRVFFKAFVRNKLEFFLNIHIYGGPSLPIKKIKIKLKKK